MEEEGLLIKALNQNILYTFIVYNPPRPGSPAFFFSHIHTDTARALHGARTPPHDTPSRARVFLPVKFMIDFAMYDLSTTYILIWHLL